MQRWTHRYQLRLINEISITPLLDVVLVLLFAFMLTAPLLQSDGALKLPSAPAANAPVPKDIIPLTVDADQTFKLDGKVVAQADLQHALQTLSGDHPDLGVVVNIHRDLPVQLLVEVMDALRQAGIRKTSVATSSPAAP